MQRRSIVGVLHQTPAEFDTALVAVGHFDANDVKAAMLVSDGGIAVDVCGFEPAGVDREQPPPDARREESRRGTHGDDVEFVLREHVVGFATTAELGAKFVEGPVSERACIDLAATAPASGQRTRQCRTNRGFDDLGRSKEKGQSLLVHIERNDDRRVCLHTGIPSRVTYGTEPAFRGR